ncbi:protein ENHANCED DOWNY MILDEW 2 isoform X1 [Primulina eburnea]|uniref:protein ENHANCED DOWNY MILDEW 2 isoform X1 n=1 Tax=Primulina eburnea TaxID=1245227 RepID=UPI003C6C20AC
MVSSDDEGETICNVSEYDFISSKDETISFTELPVRWNKTGTSPLHGKQQIFLQGKTDNGLRKIYKPVTAWKFDLSYEKPEISVFSEDGNWINLLKPRNAFVVIIRTILITVNFLHFAKWNPQGSRKALWDHLTESFRMLEIRPSEEDLLHHMSLINEAVKRDEILAKSKLLSTILEEKAVKRKAINEDAKPAFIVDDNEDEDEEPDEIDESEENESDGDDDCFDSVCAICDNGGNIILCEGKCMRSFHANIIDGEESKCESLRFNDAEVEALKNVDFYCKNCEHKRHQCFACGELGSSDDSSVAEVFRCGNGACGHFYHPYCVAKLLHPGNEAAAKEQQEKISSGEQFACPVHKCSVCKELEVRSDRELQFAICRRCPRAYHRKCLPRKIAFEKDVDMSRNLVQRAWEGLIPNRILIYCLKHDINPQLATPTRNHIKFPGVQQKIKKQLPLESSKTKLLSKGSSSALENYAGKRNAVKPPEGVEKMSFNSNLGDLSRKRLEKFPQQGSFKKQKVSSNRCSHVKQNQSNTIDSDTSLGGKLFATFYGADSEPAKSSRGERGDVEYEKCQKFKPEKRIYSSLILDADTKKRISSMMKDISSSITIDQIKRRHKGPSTHGYSSRSAAEHITLGKVEGSVQAIRGALKKLDNGGSIEDAKAVCGNDLLIQTMKWKEKMKVYLAPFLYGMRYTSFGRHFTKIEKLKEIVDVLHWYIQDGNMLVDFCCGSNDFSCLAKRKLDEVGRRCSFKNYDIHQAKDDFCFERRDWMGVRPDELPDGSRLIMGLNPPFGVNAALANKFIDKALEFKPKLLILIVPRETQRLDEKKFPYDLIWEDDQMFSGKSFYLPGSVDVHDNQIEDWNNTAPVIYLWSHPDWTSKHKDIAVRHGHSSGALKKNSLEETHHEMHSFIPKQESHNLDEPCLRKGEDKNPDKQENQEQEARVTPSRQVVYPHDRESTKDDKKDVPFKNHSEAKPKRLDDKPRKRRRSNNDKSLVDESNNKHFVSGKASPNLADGRPLDIYSSRHLERTTHVNAGRDDYQQSDSRSSYSPYSQTAYNGNQDDYLVRKYSLNPEEQYPSMPGMASRQQYSHSLNPEYDFRGSNDRWMGYPFERTDHPHVSVPGREVPISWNQRPEHLSHPGPGIPSPGRPLHAASIPFYGGMNTSAMNRYASGLGESNHVRMNNMVPRAPVLDTIDNYLPPVPRPGYRGFTPGPYYP